MNRIEVCFSPGEYHLYEQDFDLVVVLDVLRATSAICTAMEYGVGQIIPVATLEEARSFKEQGHTGPLYPTLIPVEDGGPLVGNGINSLLPASHKPPTNLHQVGFRDKLLAVPPIHFRVIGVGRKHELLSPPLQSLLRTSGSLSLK